MRQYSFNSVGLQLTFGLVPVPMTGFAQSNNIISASRRADQHMDVMSARGGMNVATLPDKSGSVSFTLLHTSNSNTLLSAQARAHQGTRWNLLTNFIPIACAIQDRSMAAGTGIALVVAKGGYIPRQPTVSRGMGISTMTWNIVFEQLAFNYGTYISTSPIEDIAG